ncbi:MAG: hypothetical protein A2540_02575 [Sulfurimonas sp. RIFOXYD2_FULL_37_8]|jgi:hypothetical protein|nr:MAG: hypothetical protein A2540_02575 [Sulfurimonas sp. RIFOXYD2_FULL_37_8]
MQIDIYCDESRLEFLIFTSQSNKESKVVEDFSVTASDAKNYLATSIVSDSTRYNFGDNTPQASSQCSPRGVTL